MDCFQIQVNGKMKAKKQADPAVTLGIARAAQPNARECAMLIAHLLLAKQEEVKKEVTRARLAEITLKRLFCRQRIPAEFLLEVQEWLLRSGWVIFSAGPTYAIVKTKVIGGWGRISSKRIAKDLNLAARGQFEFEKLEGLLFASASDLPDEDT
jgi:hypothetical protein